MSSSRMNELVSFCDPVELAQVIERGEARMSPSLRRFDYPDFFHDHETQEGDIPVARGDLLGVVCSCAQTARDYDPHEQFLQDIGALSRGKR